MDIVDYIYDERHRQHVTNYGDFARAWSFAAGSTQNADAENFGLFVEFIAMYVQPSDNEMWNISNGNLRTSHVGFMHGGSAAPAGEVRERFDRWCNILFFEMKDFGDANLQDYFEEDQSLADSFIKDLLDIHPWADGNGRTASILRNWFLGTLDDPSPLPYYYGDV